MCVKFGTEIGWWQTTLLGFETKQNEITKKKKNPTQKVKTLFLCVKAIFLWVNRRMRFGCVQKQMFVCIISVSNIWHTGRLHRNNEKMKPEYHDALT